MMDEQSRITKEVKTFQVEFQQTITEAQKFCYVTRAKEFQLQARDRLRNLSKKIQIIKRKAIAAKYEDAANQMLSLEELTDAISNELNMWIALKEDDASAAWDCLVNAQMATLSAMQAHDSASHLEAYLEHLEALEQHMYPQQMFFSPGIIIREAKCSVCKQEYGECDHVAGRPYMGELCSRLIVHADIEEASLVDNPASKHARGVILTDDEGVRRDFLSWRPVPKEINGHSKMAKKTTKPYLM
jgi:hypothetical protein